MESVGFRCAAFVAAGVLAVGAGIFQLTAQPVVAEVIDADTIVVAQGFREYEVRLANLDTPAAGSESTVPQCLGEEAVSFLRELLPAGTPIMIDASARDSHGRSIAGVYRNGVLINAELARAGFAVPIALDSPDRFYPAIESGAIHAQAAKLGLFDPSVTCTLAAEVRSAKLPARLTEHPRSSYQRDDVLAMTTDVRSLIHTWENIGAAKGNRNMVLRSTWSERYVDELKREYWNSYVAPAKKRLAEAAATVPDVEVEPDLVTDPPAKQPPIEKPRPVTPKPTLAPKPSPEPSETEPAPKPTKPTPPPKPTAPPTPKPTPSPSPELAPEPEDGNDDVVKPFVPAPEDPDEVVKPGKGHGRGIPPGHRDRG